MARFDPEGVRRALGESTSDDDVIAAMHASAERDGQWWDNRPPGDHEAPGARKRVEIGRSSGEFVELEYWPGLPGLPAESGLEDEVEWRVINEPNVPPECRSGYRQEGQYDEKHWFG